jgi:nicotinamidase-related amidase
LPQEYRIVKHKFDVFYETDLESILRNLGLDTLIITGVATEICCETAARSAICRDIKVAFATDGCATLDPNEQEASIKRIGMMFGRTMKSDEIIAELKARL